MSTDSEYDEAVRERQNGTCKWILTYSQFLDWFGPPYGMGTSRLLWLYGGPGIGKTFLSASIIEHVKQRSSHPTAFFLCTHRGGEKDQTISILRSWISQLCAQSEQALDAAKELKPSVGDPVLTLLWSMLRAILGRVDTCHLIVDGFDECVDGDPTSQTRQVQGVRQEFMNKLLHHTYLTGAKILIVSRKIKEVEKAINKACGWSPPYAVSKYHIVSSDTESDIQLLSRTIADDLQLEDSDETDRVSRQLSSGCQGMFLLLRLQRDALRPGMIREHLEKTVSLNPMPSGVDEAYSRNLKGIPRSERARGNALLRCILFAFRPLRVEELLDLCQITETDEIQPCTMPSTLTDPFIETNILRPCGGLVEIRVDDYRCKIVQFIHFSVKEFLLGSGEHCAVEDDIVQYFLFPDVRLQHGILAKQCLLYQFHLWDGAKKDRHYASPFIDKDETPGPWLTHSFNSRRGGSHVLLSAQRNLFVPGPIFDTWAMRTLNPLRVENIALQYSSSKNFTPFEAAVYFRQYAICRELLTTCPEMPPNALHFASSLRGYGSLGLLKLVMETWKDVSPDIITPYGLTPLMVASGLGNLRCVRYLLGLPDVDVNRQAISPARFRFVCQSDRYGFGYTSRGHPVMDVGGMTALSLSILNEEHDVVKLLLEKGADLGARVRMSFPLPHLNMRAGESLGGWGCTGKYVIEDLRPLHLAVVIDELNRGSTKMTALLLAAAPSLDVNSKDSNGRTPLDYVYRIRSSVYQGSKQMQLRDLLRSRGARRAIEPEKKTMNPEPSSSSHVYCIDSNAAVQATAVQALSAVPPKIEVSRLASFC